MSASDPRLQRQQLANIEQFNKTVSDLTSRCWDCCMGYPGQRLDSKTEKCITNCVQSRIEISELIQGKLVKNIQGAIQNMASSSEFDSNI